MSDEEAKKRAIRDAATVILVRQDAGRARILMGQRGAKAVFMPNKFVFPGGAVDAADGFSSGMTLAPELEEKLAARAAEGLPLALAHAAIREVWEETGLVLGTPDRSSPPDGVPDTWRGFFEAGFAPKADGMRLIFRAITPPGRPRRFDARFLMVDASKIATDLDDFSKASDELSHLQWIPLEEVMAFELAFITEIVLAELEAVLRAPDAPRPIPFFHNTMERPEFSAV